MSAAAIVVSALFTSAIRVASQTPTTSPSDQAAAQAGLRSEVIAPGIEHLQITRGYKSEKEATGPWFINLLRIYLTRARLRMVHAMDQAVGLETVSSLASRYSALAAVNSGYFPTTGAYYGDSGAVA